MGGLTHGITGLRVARSILALPVSWGELRRSRGGPWEGHARLAWREFEADRENYSSRIAAAVEVAVSGQADVLLLPAAALLHDRRFPFDRYLGLLRPVPWVVAGRMRRQRDGDFDKDAVFIHHGRVVEAFGHGRVVHERVGGVSVALAISSRIRELREPDAIDERRRGDQRPTVVLDVGHHAYPGRYARTLRSVVDHVGSFTGGPTSILLAFWRYSPSRGVASWTASNRTSSWGRIWSGHDSTDVIEVATA